MRTSIRLAGSAWSPTIAVDYRSEGKERDAETGKDNFGARYYSNRLGRFMSPDWAETDPVPGRRPEAGEAVLRLHPSEGQGSGAYGHNPKGI